MKEHLLLIPGDIIKHEGFPARFIVRHVWDCHQDHKPYNCGGTHYEVEEIEPQDVLRRMFEYSQVFIDLHYQRLAKRY